MKKALLLLFCKWGESCLATWSLLQQGAQQTMASKWNLERGSSGMLVRLSNAQTRALSTPPLLLAFSSCLTLHVFNIRILKKCNWNINSIGFPPKMELCTSVGCSRTSWLSAKINFPLNSSLHELFFSMSWLKCSHVSSPTLGTTLSFLKPKK